MPNSSLTWQDPHWRLSPPLAVPAPGAPPPLQVAVDVGVEGSVMNPDAAAASGKLGQISSMARA
jgi:hypothetical protein